MEEHRNVKLSIMLSPRVARSLYRYAWRHRWSRSNAAAVLVEAGLLDEAEQVEREQQEELESDDGESV